MLVCWRLVWAPGDSARASHPRGSQEVRRSGESFFEEKKKRKEGREEEEEF